MRPSILATLDSSPPSPPPHPVGVVWIMCAAYSCVSYVVPCFSKSSFGKRLRFLGIGYICVVTTAVSLGNPSCATIKQSINHTPVCQTPVCHTPVFHSPLRVRQARDPEAAEGMCFQPQPCIQVSSRGAHLENTTTQRENPSAPTSFGKPIHHSAVLQAHTVPVRATYPAIMKHFKRGRWHQK